METMNQITDINQNGLRYHTPTAIYNNFQIRNHKNRPITETHNLIIENVFTFMQIFRDVIITLMSP